VYAAAIGLLQTSCAGVSDETTSTSAGETTAAANAQEIVADFRTIDTQVAAIESASTNSAGATTDNAKIIVDAALGPGSFERYRLADSAQGFFTNKGQQQTLHIIVNRRVTAVAKDTTPSILVVFQDSRPVTQFVLTKASYVGIASVFDIDLDGLNEVLLTSNAYQMGSLFIAADMYGFEDSGNILKQEMGVVYENACDSSIVKNPKVSALVLSLTQNTEHLTTQSFSAICNTNGKPPSSELFEEH